MSSQPRNVTSVNQIDPTIQPYLAGGLKEAERLYSRPAAYFPEATYVSPSDATEAAILARTNRAIQGSPISAAGRAGMASTIGGEYLGGNPFFQGAFQGAAQAAGREYNQAVNQALSNSSRAGRFGSGAMNTALSSANAALANSLSNTAGNLAYQNYERERDIQNRAILGAPEFANYDYRDISELAGAGATRESYDEMALKDRIARFNYYNDLPSNRLAEYMSYVYGAPQGSVTTTPVFRNVGGSILGGGLTGASIGSAIPGIGTGLGAIAGGLLGLL